MCNICDLAKAQGRPQPLNLHGDPSIPSSAPLLRRSFLRAGAAASAAFTATLAGCGAAASTSSTDFSQIGATGYRTLLRGGTVMSMDPAVGNFPQGDVLLEGDRILQVGSNISADANVVDIAGMIVMPGFVDTHHHQFETALRSYLADAVLLPDGRPETTNYFETVLNRLAPLYRPQDVYISELFGSLSQIDAGVTAVMDVSQIHHSPAHSDAAIEALRAAGRRAVFGYFEGAGKDTKYPQDARRIKRQWFSSQDQLLTMIMGGEIYLPGHETAWALGRELNVPIALHVVGSFGMQTAFDSLGAAGKFGADNIFIHMTGMSDLGWKYVADAGAHVSLATAIEMHMRHGTPPVQKALDLGLQPSLSSDVECTMAADMFTQMRSVLTVQRMLANEKALNGQPYPRLLTAYDAIRLATIEGAKGLKLDHKTGSLTPGKQADLILLDATALNVAPLNHAPGAVATLMDRSNVEAVLVAGKVKKWRGALVDVDVPKLRKELHESRDYLFNAAGLRPNLFRS